MSVVGGDTQCVTSGHMCCMAHASHPGFQWFRDDWCHFWVWHAKPVTHQFWFIISPFSALLLPQRCGTQAAPRTSQYNKPVSEGTGGAASHRVAPPTTANKVGTSKTATPAPARGPVRVRTSRGPVSRGRGPSRGVEVQNSYPSIPGGRNSSPLDSWDLEIG